MTILTRTDGEGHFTPEAGAELDEDTCYMIRVLNDGTIIEYVHDDITPERLARCRVSIFEGFFSA